MIQSLKKGLRAGAFAAALATAFGNAGAARAGLPDIDLPIHASGFSEPIFATHAGDGSGRIFVVEQRGKIRIVTGPGTVLGTEFLDLGIDGLDLVSRSGSEQGLLGLVFHPDYANNGRFFVSYTQRSGGASLIAEYNVSSGNPNVAGTTGVPVIGPIAQPEGNHNGGMILFGPDDNFYFLSGDGGGGGDFHGPNGNGQNLNTLLGKILRITVSPTALAGGYTSPVDNPFANDGDPNTRAEIYAYGLRNPWRGSFDRGTGRFFVGDVGQNRLEEVDLIDNGDNLGWRIQEGTECFNPANFESPLGSCNTAGLEPPITEYGRSLGTAVTGGYVYRGSMYPNMTGLYIFGDYGSGRIWQLTEPTPGVFARTELINTNFNISSFGEDEEGELYLCDYGGGNLRRVEDLSVQPTPTPTPTPSPTPLGLRNAEIFE